MFEKIYIIQKKNMKEPTIKSSVSVTKLYNELVDSHKNRETGEEPA